jgi:hypothetical protein
MRLPSLLSLLALTSTIPSLQAAPTDNEIAKRKTVKRQTIPRLSMYVQTFHDTSGNPLSLLPLLKQKTRVTHVILASLHLNDPPGNIHLNDNPPNASMFDHVWSDVKVLQQNGIKVMAMLGGAAQGSYQRLSGTDAQFNSYYEPLLQNVIKQYNLDGLDLDIEEYVDVSVPLRLLNRLYTDTSPKFLLTMAPVASALASPTGGDLSGFSYFDLDSQAVVPGTTNKLLAWYNAQFYSGFGDPSTPAGYQSIIDAGWAPARVAMAVLDSAHDGNGFVPLATLAVSLKQLRALYPAFGGLSAWEYFDAGSSDGLAAPWLWAKSIASALFGAVSRRHARLPVRAADAPRLSAPFAAEAIRSLQDRGAGWFEAVRALNLTSADVEAAGRLLRV